ncbi:hypothetical protein C2G38_1298060 [Gigaspora rosea]|uniref:triacylglycerol lipase n=1 Tax=Gigaspora rosea TaxID=44941 RepID=A0A397W7X3_9GLOM|nr:hypothetical protein C2G38_1298060 [Gigaspora rosea]
MDRKEERELLPDVLDRETVISLAKMTYKLTPKSPTETSMIWDNLLFSCCCAKVDPTVCDCHIKGFDCNMDLVQESVDVRERYYTVTRNLFKVIADSYPGAKVWSTGHSLGGALSALVGLTYGIPVVAYESPGERLPAKRLHLPGPPTLP